MKIMKDIELKAYAKINLGLDVLRKREDGYHELRMIMQTVGIYDRVYIRRTRKPGIFLTNNLSFLPTDEGNLAWKAARLLMDEFPSEEGVFINLHKYIPVAAGLAGGSSDAAAVLVGLNKLLNLSLSREQLMERAVRLGADVPYCILRGTALAEGIGEILTPLTPPPQCTVVLAKPDIHVSTKTVYSMLKADDITDHPDIDLLIRCIRNGDLASLAKNMGNVLETVTVSSHPVIESIKKTMRDHGALGAMMSGSGPTVFGLYSELPSARTTVDCLRENGLAKQIYITDFLRVNRDDRRS